MLAVMIRREDHDDMLYSSMVDIDYMQPIIFSTKKTALKWLNREGYYEDGMEFRLNTNKNIIAVLTEVAELPEDAQYVYHARYGHRE